MIRRFAIGASLMAGIGVPTALWPLHVMTASVAVLLCLCAYAIGAAIEEGLK